MKKDKNEKTEKTIETETKKNDEKAEVKYQKALVTSRVLFISVLDKIYLIALGLWFVFGTISNFTGDIASLNYGFWGRVKDEIIFLIILFIVYLFLNWLYKCIAKTMLCLTKNEVYREHYIPFKRSEDSIPLNKITKVSTVNFFWIFRSVIIHQYHAFPLVFFTWNNQEFKDKLTELITTDKDKVENEYKDRNLVTKEMYKYLRYLGIILAAIICLLGIIRLFAYLFNSERNIAGTYTYKENEVTLKKNGTCELEEIVSYDITSCNWTYDSDDKEVEIVYEYKSSFYGYSSDGSLTLDFNSKNKSLEYNDMELTK